MFEPKHLVRKGTLFNRKMLAPEVWKSRNDQVCRLASEFLEQENVSSFHVFLPIRRNNEVDLWALINDSFLKGHQIIVSSTDFEAETMSHFVYTKELVFEEDQFGIPTPINGQGVDLKTLQLIFIPMLAGDKKGNRIGYGKGYYDRLMSEMPKGILKIGLSLNPLFDEFTFAEPHDVRLNAVATPWNIHDFG